MELMQSSVKASPVCCSTPFSLTVDTMHGARGFCRVRATRGVLGVSEDVRSERHGAGRKEDTKAMATGKFGFRVVTRDLAE